MEDKKFIKMGLDSPLVKELISKNPKWWQGIVSLTKQDKDFNVQIRKDYINVYCLMGNFMKIDFKKNTLVGKIHRKYIPFKPLKKEYLKLSLNDEVSLGEKYEPQLITKDLLTKGHPHLLLRA
ncbi:MAG: hypothetical protein ABSA04_00005 [Desulfobaccales bacterium]|jgi:hypothetical protein